MTVYCKHCVGYCRIGIMRLYYRGLKNYLYYQNRVALKGAIKATIRAIIIRIQYRGPK